MANIALAGTGTGVLAVIVRNLYSDASPSTTAPITGQLWPR